MGCVKVFQNGAYRAKRAFPGDTEIINTAGKMLLHPNFCRIDVGIFSVGNFTSATEAMINIIGHFLGHPSAKDNFTGQVSAKLGVNSLYKSGRRILHFGKVKLTRRGIDKAKAGGIVAANHAGKIAVS